MTRQILDIFSIINTWKIAIMAFQVIHMRHTMQLIVVTMQFTMHKMYYLITTI